MFHLNSRVDSFVGSDTRIDIVSAYDNYNNWMSYSIAYVWTLFACFGWQASQSNIVTYVFMILFYLISSHMGHDHQANMMMGTKKRITHKNVRGKIMN